MSMPVYPFRVEVTRRTNSSPNDKGRHAESKSYVTLAVAMAARDLFTRQPMTTSVRVVAVLDEWTRGTDQ